METNVNKSKPRGSSVSQVTFLNVPSRYPGDDDVTVTYVLNGSWKRSSYDWIGLFKKGNEGVKDYVTYVWTGILSALPSSEDKEVESGRSVVCFQAYYLPQSDRTTPYHFAYVTKQGNIRGRSSEFMFGSEDATSSTGSDSDCDLVMVEDEKAKYENLRDDYELILKEKEALEQDLEEQAEAEESAQALLEVTENKLQAVSEALERQYEAEKLNAEDRRESEMKLKQKIASFENALKRASEEKNCLALRFENNLKPYNEAVEFLKKKVSYLEKDLQKSNEKNEIIDKENELLKQKLQEKTEAADNVQSHPNVCDKKDISRTDEQFKQQVTEENNELNHEMQEKIASLEKALKLANAERNELAATVGILSSSPTCSENHGALTDQNVPSDKEKPNSMLETSLASYAEQLRDEIEVLKQSKTALLKELEQTERKMKAITLDQKKFVQNCYEAKRFLFMNEENQYLKLQGSKFNELMEFHKNVTSKLIAERNEDKRFYQTLLIQAKNEISELKEKLQSSEERSADYTEEKIEFEKNLCQAINEIKLLEEKINNYETKPVTVHHAATTWNANTDSNTFDVQPVKSNCLPRDSSFSTEVQSHCDGKETPKSDSCPAEKSPQNNRKLPTVIDRIIRGVLK